MTSQTLLQISDLHVMPESGQTLLGVDTENYFHRVLDLAFRTHPEIETVLVTGDLMQHPTVAGYRRIAERLQSYGRPCICLPGNHDDEQLLNDALTSGLVRYQKQHLLGNWQLIALNSRIAGQAGGRLDVGELNFLNACLTNASELYALIAVHHHCLPIGSRWMDEMVLENGTELLELAALYPQVKAITCGHIHQESDRQHRGLRLLSAPSTCFQFEPGSRNFRVTCTAPGYRIFQLDDTGHLETKVLRLPEELREVQIMAEIY